MTCATGAQGKGRNSPSDHRQSIQAPAGPVLFYCHYLTKQLSALQKKNPGISAGVSITDNVRSD